MCSGVLVCFGNSTNRDFSVVEKEETQDPATGGEENTFLIILIYFHLTCKTGRCLTISTEGVKNKK